MIALNKNEIRKRSVRFWSLFGVLVLSTLVVVYFFVWSAHKESEDYIVKIVENRAAMNKQIALQGKIDSLYTQVKHLEYGEVADYYFLESIIRDQRRAIQQLIGADSLTRFAGYRRVVDHLDRQIQLKDTILTLISTVEDTRRNLEDCKLHNRSIGRSLVRGSRQ